MQEKNDRLNPERVNLLISYIEKNVGKNNTTVNEHLFYIKSLLKQSLPLEGEEINIAKIHEAIHYIETMKIKVPHSIFSEKLVTMADLMRNRGEVILPAYERKQKPINLRHPIDAVSASAENQFGSLHNALVALIMPHYQFLNEEKLRKTTKKPSIAWNYDYPLDDSNEIMNQAIGEWQANYIKRNSDATKAYRDFTRSTSIRGLTATTNKEVEDLLDYLIAGSDYPQDCGNNIRQWLQANGGQDINRFLDTLMLSGEFTPEETTSLLNTKGIEQVWCIENGKVVFLYSPIVYSLCMERGIMINDGTGKLTATQNPEHIKDNKTGNYRVLPIMDVKAKIELNAVGDEVIPSITKLSVTSYSSDLVKPEPKVLDNTNSIM
ncbi:hypothetical protein DGG96_07575 [Legionella qingyii]|uniref:Uncharacterized protein n=1 Tax=Legionella qingyii TaxID=2184757 RepID=A0A317U6M7_9GAMM|nr:hypothetical protein [Legionella qingyii]PWY56192.1 hypothetical protein DGG96_07575 [Legionella qingyii]RUR22219.1 hypothetical protein ELY20_09950 [Legionella qingyii]RUR25789.1 hypothetical protein ELY16_09050 [Legionella qingyii]